MSASSSRPRWRDVVAWGAPAVGVVLLVMLAVRFGGGVAGTDEYWYAGDLLMTEATGARVSNHVYPLYAASAPPGTLPPRMHDAPVTHVASWLFGLLNLTDPGVAWTAVNVALTVVTAVVVLLTARRLEGNGGWAASMVLLVPVTVWAALSSLAEAGLACGTAVLAGALVAAERTGRGAWWIVSGAAIGLLVWGRSNFVVLLAVWLGWTVWSWRRGRVRAGWAGAAILTAVVIVGARAVFTDAYPNAGFAATLMVGAAGRSSNMDFYFAPVVFDAGRFLDKAASGLWRAVTPRTVDAWWAVGPVVVAGLVGVVGNRRRMLTDAALAGVTTLAGGSVVMYLATAMVFQPQTRYLYAATPVVAVLLDVALTRAWRRVGPTWRAVAVTVAVACAVAAAGRGVEVARLLDDAGRRADLATSRMRAVLDAAAPEGAVLAFAPGDATDIGVAYAAIPRPVISVDPKLNSPDEVRRLSRTWGVSLVVAPTKRADLPDAVFDGRLTPAGRAGAYTVWRVKQAPDLDPRTVTPVPAQFSPEAVDSLSGTAELPRSLPGAIARSAEAGSRWRAHRPTRTAVPPPMSLRTSEPTRQPRPTKPTRPSRSLRSSGRRTGIRPRRSTLSTPQRHRVPTPVERSAGHGVRGTRHRGPP